MFFAGGCNRHIILEEAWKLFGRKCEIRTISGIGQKTIVCQKRILRRSSIEIVSDRIFRVFSLVLKVKKCSSLQQSQRIWMQVEKKGWLHSVKIIWWMLLLSNHASSRSYFVTGVIARFIDIFDQNLWNTDGIESFCKLRKELSD